MRQYNYDVNNDGKVSKFDRDYLIDSVIDMYFGDANLGGTVNFTDFLQFSDKFGRQAD